MATKYDNIAGLISQGSGGVDYLGNFNRGAQLAQSTSNIYDNMSAKRALMSAQESGDPYQLGAALKSAQVIAPEYATSVSAARAAPAITLGKQNQALAEDRAFVAQQALQATPEQRIQLLNQEANELASNGFDPTPVKNLIDLTMQGQHDAVTQQLQAHLAAATQGSQQNEAYGQLYSAKDMQGNPIQFQLSKNGQPIVLGGGNAQIDPATVAPISYDPELNRQRSYASETGTQTAQTEAITPKEIEKSNAEFVIEAPSMVNDYQMFKGQTKDIKEVLKNANEVASIWNTGFVGSLSKAVPGTPAADFATEIDILNANLALDSLAALKAASASGASGLGATNKAEFEALQSEVGALRQSNSPESFKRNLQRVEKRIDRYQANRDAIFDRANKKYESLTGKRLVEDQESMDSQYGIDLPEGATDADVKAVMAAHGYSREEAIKIMNDRKDEIK